LLYEWLQRPHVKRWYTGHGTYEEVVAHYLPAIDGRDPTDHFVLLDGCPIGMVQTYVVADFPEYARTVGVPDSDTAGVDILIGVEELTGRGLGEWILRSFVGRPRCSECRVGTRVREGGFPSRASGRRPGERSPAHARANRALGCPERAEVRDRVAWLPPVEEPLDRRMQHDVEQLG
jgi:hypothetical protein